MSSTLCPQVVSQAPQHFKSSHMQASYEGCFARQSICSVFCLHSGMPMAVRPQEFSKVDVEHMTYDTCQLGFQFHFSQLVASSLNL